MSGPTTRSPNLLPRVVAVESNSGKPVGGTGLTGAVAATRYVGGTASIAPTTGTFAVGDYVVTQAGSIFVCTVSGSPGTWVQAGGGAAGADTALSNLSNTGTARANLRVPVLLPAACVATANVALTGLQTIDGYTLVDGDQALLTAQTTASQNGPWVAHSGAWVRPTDFPTAAVLKARTICIISGTAHAGETWLLQTNASITIDATAQTWVLAALPAAQKGAVNGVATLDATGKVPPGQVPVVRPIPAVGARSFLPNGVKLRGANLTVKPSYPLTNDGFTNQGAWGKYYLDWDWAGWIKPQIDHAIAEGCNAIRQIGDVFGLKLGYYTQATYLAHWQQLIEYCVANNLYVYATGGSELHFGGATYAEAAAYVAAYASFVNQYPNVIALDMLQEIPDATAGRITNLTIVRNAVKAANPNLPATFSMASVNGFNAATVQALDPIVDYFDGHAYSTQVEGILNYVPGSGYNTIINPKPLMIGEFGAAQSQTSGQRVAHAKSIRDWLARHPSVIGCFYWTLADQDVSGTASNEWGLYTNARTTLNNGGPLTLPASTITVVSTAGAGTQDSPAFPSTGTFQMGGYTFTYTGKTSTTFTGVTVESGGSGVIADGSPIYVRRADIGDVLRTFPERVAPLVIERVLATDTTISATNAINNIQQSIDLRFPTPMLVKMEATADIDILTAGNVYSVQISVPGSGQTMDGSTMTIPKGVGGGAVGRVTLHTTYEAILPAGYQAGSFFFQIGHVSGSAADAVAKATNCRARWELTPL